MISMNHSQIGHWLKQQVGTQYTEVVSELDLG